MSHNGGDGDDGLQENAGPRGKTSAGMNADCIVRFKVEVRLSFKVAVGPEAVEAVEVVEAYEAVRLDSGPAANCQAEQARRL